MDYSIERERERERKKREGESHRPFVGLRRGKNALTAVELKLNVADSVVKRHKRFTSQFMPSMDAEDCITGEDALSNTPCSSLHPPSHPATPTAPNQMTRGGSLT